MESKDVRVPEINCDNIDILTSNDVDVEFEGEFLINGEQLAKEMGYFSTHGAINRHVDKDCRVIIKINGSIIVDNVRKNLNDRETIFLTERGMTQLVDRTFLFSTSEKLKILSNLNMFIGESVTDMAGISDTTLDNLSEKMKW